jgi:hypothetical protein
VWLSDDAHSCYIPALYSLAEDVVVVKEDQLVSTFFCIPMSLTRPEPLCCATELRVSSRRKINAVSTPFHQHHRRAPTRSILKLTAPATWATVSLQCPKSMWAVSGRWAGASLPRHGQNHHGASDTGAPLIPHSAKAATPLGLAFAPLSPRSRSHMASRATRTPFL